jgi:hypothetical protein
VRNQGQIEVGEVRTDDHDILTKAREAEVLGDVRRIDMVDVGGVHNQA